MSLETVEAALRAIKNGEFVVVADDEDRVNEGDLIIAAEAVTTEKLAFMLRYTSGVVCVGITHCRANELALPLMVAEKGAGEVRLGKLPNGKRMIATIEPFHGNEVVINPEAESGMWSAKRVLLDTNLAEGHALAAADFLGLGHDQLIAGWRKKDKDGKVGIRMYVPTAEDGSTWKLHATVDDNTMACEDFKVADLNGDGKPDIIAAGRATKNLVVYWNERR